MIKHNILYRGSLLIIFAALGITLYVLYLLNWPFEVIKMKTHPLPVLKKELVAGEEVPYILDICKKVNVSGIVSVTFVNELVYSVSKFPSDIPLGCQEFVAVNTTIPKVLPLGKYHLAITAKYKVNPFRTITYEFETEEFLVTEK